MKRATSTTLGAVMLVSLAAVVLLAGAQHAVPRSTTAAPAPTWVSPEQVPRGTGHLAARIVRPLRLRDRPGGRILRRIGTRTEFGSPSVLAVVAQRPGWLGVLTPHVANSRSSWIPGSGAQLQPVAYSLRADLSARTLVVRLHRRIVRRISVAIGRPGTSTPTGRFAVTDVLAVREKGSPYGCCVLALSGRQPNVPQGWTGGNRLAIHGTTNERTLGTPASLGCLRAAETDMRWLMAVVAAGSPVFIEA
ncbi:MAG TPA: L,D-transpeptidase [Solirubrobacteraceae bacterium]|nr:L,D-transpeptidase [Solirubrobacteraceae bacterium]